MLDDLRAYAVDEIVQNLINHCIHTTDKTKVNVHTVGTVKEYSLGSKEQFSLSSKRNS